jgi:hypothetical protein
MNPTYFALDNDHKSLGVFDAFSKVEFVPAYNVARGWLAEMDLDSDQAEMMLNAFYLKAISESGVDLWTGTIDKGHIVGNTNTLQLSGVDETGRLNSRQILPVPSGPPYTAEEYYSLTDTAENVIKTLVDVNAGPSAKADRILPGLSIEANYGRGGSYSAKARFDKLGDFIFDIGLAKGLWVRVVNGILRIDLPSDKSNLVRISDQTDTLGDYEFEFGRPSANYVYGAGTGTGTSQAIYERGDGDSITQYGRYESLLNIGRTAVEGEIADAIDAELEKKKAVAWFSFTVNDLPDRILGKDYWVGDVVAVMVRNRYFTTRVSEVAVTSTPDGTAMKPVFVNSGSYAISRSSYYDRVKSVESRLERLEAK